MLFDILVALLFQFSFRIIFKTNIYNNILFISVIKILLYITLHYSTLQFDITIYCFFDYFKIFILINKNCICGQFRVLAVNSNFFLKHDTFVC